MPDTTDARRVLASLARTDDESGTEREDGPDDYRAVIRDASEATESLESAATFCDDVGLDTLEAAIERADAEVSACATEGRDALETLRRLDSATSSGPDGPTI